MLGRPGCKYIYITTPSEEFAYLPNCLSLQVFGAGLLEHTGLGFRAFGFRVQGLRVAGQDGVDCKYMIDKTTPTGACAVTIMNKDAEGFGLGFWGSLSHRTH